jgi:hypothetical protein
VPADPGLAPAPSARTILIADAIWDALLGAGLIIATVNSATAPVSAPALRPWPLFAVLAAACLAGTAFLLYLSTQPQAATACRSISPANMAATIAAIALLLTFPHLAHAYVVALAIASTGCAVFAVLEWNAAARP